PSLLRYSHACTPARLLVFFFPAPSPPALSTLSLHDALPISGTPVHFRITLPRDLSCSAARLVVEQEGAGTSVLDMFWCGMNGSQDRKSTRLNSNHVSISYAVFCLKKKNKRRQNHDRPCNIRQ